MYIELYLCPWMNVLAGRYYANRNEPMEVTKLVQSNWMNNQRAQGVGMSIFRF